MGFLIDSSVLIAAERRELSREDLQGRFGAETVAVAAITASELLHGVHRAEKPARRRRRATFVDALLGELPVIAFDLSIARIHASVWADLARTGTRIGAHDLLIAATAVRHDLAVATRNPRDFERVEGLRFEVW